MRALTRLIVLLCGCKAEVDGGVGVDADIDAVVADAAAAAAPPLGLWSAPRTIPSVATAGISEDDATLSSNQLEMIFARADPMVDNGLKHLFYMSRPSATSTAWSAPVQLPFTVLGSSDETPRFAAGDTKLFFASGRAGTLGSLDIWEVTRPAAGSQAWGTPTQTAEVSSAAVDKWCMPCGGGRYLLVSSRSPSTSADLYEGTVGGGAPTLSSLSSAQSETGPFLTKDCLTVYFASTRGDGVTNKLYTATRASVSAPWPTPTLVEDFVALGGSQEDPWVSDDGRTFVLTSNVAGTKDVYISTR
jgi:hypothetical protein